MGIHRPRGHERAVSPDLLQELVARCDGAGAADEREEELVRLRRQRARSAVAGHHPRARVDDDVAEMERRWTGWRAVAGGATKQCAHTLEQLEDAERLRHILVGVETETAHLVRLFGLRREDDDRRLHAATAQRL